MLCESVFHAGIGMTSLPIELYEIICQDLALSDIVALRQSAKNPHYKLDTLIDPDSIVGKRHHFASLPDTKQQINVNRIYNIYAENDAFKHLQAHHNLSCLTKLFVKMEYSDTVFVHCVVPSSDGRSQCINLLFI